MPTLEQIAEKVDLSQITLAPFPAEELPKLWAWMHEFPRATMDDTSPAALDDFRMLMLDRMAHGHKLVGVWFYGELVGAVGFLRTSMKTGRFSGICFTKEVHGTGVARIAVDFILKAWWAEGLKKISASFFADNLRVHAFLKKLGAHNEGLFRGETTRDGKPLDVRTVAFFRPEVN